MTPFLPHRAQRDIRTNPPRPKGESDRSPRASAPRASAGRGLRINSRAVRRTIRTLFGVVMILSPAISAGPAAGQDIVRGEAARLRAAELGLRIAGEDTDGRRFELQQFHGSIPFYYITDNHTAAATVGANLVHPGGAAGLSLTGQGVTLGIWDAGRVRLGHVEFGGRAVQRDAATSNHFHATHVAGTMIAQGANAAAKGMSFEANLDCRDWNNDLNEMTGAAGAGLLVSNHSYGIITGWLRVAAVGPIDPRPRPIRGEIPVTEWIWFGDVDVDAFEDHFFGRYDTEARQWDQAAFDNPHYLWCKSAGNDRNDGPTPGTGHLFFDPVFGDLQFSTAPRSRDGNNGYDSVSHSACAKNGLIVGAVNDVPLGYGGPQTVGMSSFSCWGPTDDGRIKPDIVANGVGLFSSVDTTDTSYTVLSGTSMSSPNVSGSLGLLIQHWRNTHPGEDDMRSSTLKGLVLHTANECGPAVGPDYQFGWGLLNVRGAADLITLDASLPLVISEQELLSGDSVEYTVFTDGSSNELRATICWTDPPFTAGVPATLDNPTSVLINDLDLRLSTLDQVYSPWVLDRLDPSAPATTGDNSVDNVEQVVISTPGVNAYRLQVTHKGALSGGAQVFSLIVSGANEITQQIETIAPRVASANPVRGSLIGALPSMEVTFDEPVFRVQAADLEINGSPATAVSGSGAGPYRFSGYAVPEDGAVTVRLDAGAITDIFENAFAGDGWSNEIRDCNDNDRLDLDDIAQGVSGDCNGNSLPDECDPDALRVHSNVDQTMAFGELITLGGAGLVSGGTAPYTFEWTLRGNNEDAISTSVNPTFQPTQPGTYAVRLIVTDAIGCRAIGFVTVRVSQSDLAGPLPPPSVTVGGAFCPLSGGMAALSLAAALMGRKAARRVRMRRGRRE